MKGLYIHIPFCKRKCPYCAFYSETRLFLIQDHIQGLLQEALEFEGMAFSTVYMGGGTPSVLSPEHFEELTKGLARIFELSGVQEFTVEINPESCDEKLLKTMRNSGVNRLSLGFQSLHQKELDLLGRAHTVEESHKCLQNAVGLGFDNINIDLMFGFRGQSLPSWRETLEKASRLPVSHISTYSLTPKGGISQLDEETLVQMFRLRDQVLEPSGFHRYEISNYCLPGKESLHNLVYWEHESYLGLGPSAASFDGKIRWNNEPDLLEYIKEPGKGRLYEQLEQDQLLLERIFLGLRLSQGIDPGPVQIPEELREFIEPAQNGIRLSAKGVLVADRVALELWEMMENQR